MSKSEKVGIHFISFFNRFKKPDLDVNVSANFIIYYIVYLLYYIILNDDNVSTNFINTNFHQAELRFIFSQSSMIH